MAKNKKSKKEKKTSKIDANNDKENISLDDQLKVEKDKNLRLFAEFENFRKRTAKERLDLLSSANKELITKLLPVLDNFERSISANNFTENDGPVIIYNQLKQELVKNGLKEIENPIGKELDTEFHESITNVPAPKKELKNKIVDVIEKGYLLGEKVIRYAKVVVGN
tara:strand:- start:64209 stop:64709 length:501 start_codon:yes stop_codon:yes gene_type:complete